MKELSGRKKQLIHFLGFIQNINHKDDLINIQSVILEYLQQINSMDLKILMILSADEYFIKLIGFPWTKYFIETQILKSNYGGLLFFENLNNFIKTQDTEMTKMYLFVLKTGFKGCKTTEDVQKYYSIGPKICAAGNLPQNNIPFHSKKEARSYNWLAIFIFIFFLCKIGLYVFETIEIKLLCKNLMEGVYE